MASASALLPPFLSGLHRSQFKSNFLPPFQIRKTPNPNRSPIFASSSSLSSSSSSSWEEREEIRWLREEQRWLREEQRWIREELRWRSERESLIREITALRFKIEALERGKSLDASIGRISEVGDGRGRRLELAEEADVKEMILEARVSEGKEGSREEKEKEVVKEMIVEEEEVKVRVSDEEIREEMETAKKKARRTLRKGSEGDDVRALQEALLKLGFYSGEEDMEYSSFSSGTESAVKTWQASLGTLEDGIMTSELLARLYMERSFKEVTNQGGDSVSGAVKDGTNGVATASMAEITEIKETIIKEAGDTEIEVSEHRVFLLGENRWEDPSRLKGRDKPISGSKVTSPTKCLTCRGEGRLMCTECDGTGEPNIEPQFLEWVGEGTKCPYCEGRGYTVCDGCEGNGAAAKI